MNFGKLARGKQFTENNSDMSSIPSINFNNEIENNENNQNNIRIINKIVIEEQNISLHTFNYIFEINDTKMKSSNEYFTIYNKNGNYCIRIKKDFEEPTEIYLQHLNFFESCAKNKSLIRKTGTIEMLLSILQYVSNFYNTELKYIFQDDSSINISGHILKLNLIYILLYGETLYMKNLNAYCLSEEFNINLQIINEYLNTNKDNLAKFFLKSFEFDYDNNNIFENAILEDFINLISKNNRTITKKQVWWDIKKIYRSSTTSRDFLQLLHKKYGMSIFIILNYYEYYQYISIKLKKILSFENYMQIPNEFINSIDILDTK